jgi:hypothetical protein
VATFRLPLRIAEIKDTIGLPVEPVEPIKKELNLHFFGQRA